MNCANTMPIENCNHTEYNVYHGFHKAIYSIGLRRHLVYQSDYTYAISIPFTSDRKSSAYKIVVVPYPVHTYPPHQDTVVPNTVPAWIRR